MKESKYGLEKDDKKDLVNRSYKFALRIIQLADKLSNSSLTYPIRDQLIRSGTSVGSNAEEASAGFSRGDFIFKMSIASEEARETNYWLRLIRDSGTAKTKEFEEENKEAITESNELKKILTSIVETSKEKSKQLKIAQGEHVTENLNLMIHNCLSVRLNSKLKTHNSKLEKALACDSNVWNSRHHRS